MEPRIALQTFTIRGQLKTPKALAAALVKLKSLGIKWIELARIGFSDAELDVVAGLRGGAGPAVACLQIKPDVIAADPDRVLRMLERLDCPSVSVSVIPLRALKDGSGALATFAGTLNRLGRHFRSGGKRLLFHHHHFEFLRFDGQLALDLLVAQTDPELVGFVVDTYWAQRGGCDPASLIRRLSGRVGGLHLRDYRVVPGLNNLSPDLLPRDAPVGDGNLDIPSIVEACRASGVPYMAIEQDSKRPFEDVARSIANLKVLGFADLF